MKAIKRDGRHSGPRSDPLSSNHRGDANEPGLTDNSNVLMKRGMTMFKKTTIAVLALTIAATATISTGASARGGNKSRDMQDIERLSRDEARGGPYVDGGRSHGGARYKVCQTLSTPEYDYDTGRRVYVTKERCWWE